MKCPKCGSENVATRTRYNTNGIYARSECYDCGHEWTEDAPHPSPISTTAGDPQ